MFNGKKKAKDLPCTQMCCADMYQVLAVRLRTVLTVEGRPEGFEAAAARIQGVNICELHRAAQRTSIRTNPPSDAPPAVCAL